MRPIIAISMLSLPLILAFMQVDAYVIAIVGVAACVAVCYLLSELQSHDPAAGPASPSRIDRPHSLNGPHSDILPFRRGS